MIYDEKAGTENEESQEEQFINQFLQLAMTGSKLYLCS
jgi:hypothetical protein